MGELRERMIDAMRLRNFSSKTDLSLIQRLLGHTNLRTTSVYLHLQKASFEKIINPLDRLAGEWSGKEKQQ